MKTEILEPEKTIRAGRSPDVSLKKVLVPVDFSPASDQAFQQALRLAESFHLKLILLHVLEPPGSLAFAGLARASSFSKTAASDAETNVRALLATVSDEGRKNIRWKIRTGLAAHEIVEAAQEEDVDLIVIGTHGFSSGKHFCIGTTAERVARAAPCSVLVVREKEYEF